MTELEKARDTVISWARIVTRERFALGWERRGLSMAIERLQKAELADAEDRRIRSIVNEELALATRTAEANEANEKLYDWCDDRVDDLWRGGPKKRAKKGKRK